MIGRWSLLVVGLVIGIALARAVPGLPQLFPVIGASSTPPQGESADEHNPGAGSADDRQGAVKLSAEAIEAAGIDVAAVQSGTIARRIVVPGKIVPHADR